MKSILPKTVSDCDWLRVVCTAVMLTTWNIPVIADAPATKFPALPEPTTSFGAAVSAGWLYVYGGHTGKTHQYSSEVQSNRFRRLNLAQPGDWEELPGEARLQGLALVAHGGKLYRLGGFSAKNRTGDKNDLWSVADVSRFDPVTKTWEQLPPLPEPRSSHDAVVLDNQIYVAGGWAMQGGRTSSQWHQDAVVLDLSQSSLAWKKLPRPPFVRRAVALATQKGKVYVIGGMDEVGGTLSDVDYFDPATNAWQSAPDLPGESIEGFGNSACELGGQLFVSTIEGHVQRLDGDQWTLVTKLKHPRYFHRMLPFSSDEFICVGGTARSGQRVTEIETVQLTAPAAK